MSINNSNLLIHTCAKLFILGSYIKEWQICHRRSTNKSHFDIPVSTCSLRQHRLRFVVFLA